MDDEVVDEEIEFATNDGDYVDAQVDEKYKDDNGIEDADAVEVNATIEVACQAIETTNVEFEFKYK